MSNGYRRGTYNPTSALGTAGVIGGIIGVLTSMAFGAGGGGALSFIPMALLGMAGVFLGNQSANAVTSLTASKPKVRSRNPKAPTTTNSKHSHLDADIDVNIPEAENKMIASNERGDTEKNLSASGNHSVSVENAYKKYKDGDGKPLDVQGVEGHSLAKNTIATEEHADKSGDSVNPDKYPSLLASNDVAQNALPAIATNKGKSAEVNRS